MLSLRMFDIDVISSLYLLKTLSINFSGIRNPLGEPFL